MDLFKFNSGGFDAQPWIPNSGQMINGATRTMWVERYDEPGEFEIEAPLSSDLKKLLPLGTLISHVKTTEVMMVEDHEISENLTEDSTIKITGRSLCGWFENRIVGQNLARAAPGHAIVPYSVLANASAQQIVNIINDHVQDAADGGDDVPNFIAETIVSSGAAIERIIERKDLLSVVLELLGIDNLGISSNRSVFSPDDVLFRIYKGEDRTSQVVFSWTGGDLDAMSYLFTNRKHKTSAMVVGQYIWRVVDTYSTTKTGYKRRMMLIDASDVDGHLDTVPTGGPLTDVYNELHKRGIALLRKQRVVRITNADVANLSDYQYRHHYFMGDLVTVEGDFNQQEVKRVVEFAEVEDENGYTGHPSLQDPYEDDEE